MLSLYKKPPTSVEVDGVEHALDMSFDNILHILEMLKDERLSDVAKVMTGLNMLFEEMPKGDLKDLVTIWAETFNKVVNPGEAEDDVDYDIKGNPMPRQKEVSKKVIDLTKDAEYIYASFLQDYKIDLFEEQGKLHWHKFMSLLNGLSDSTRLRKVIEIRQMPLPKGKGTEEQRKEVIKLKRYYALDEKEVEEDGGRWQDNN